MQTDALAQSYVREHSFLLIQASKFSPQYNSLPLKQCANLIETRYVQSKKTKSLPEANSACLSQIQSQNCSQLSKLGVLSLCIHVFLTPFLSRTGLWDQSTKRGLILGQPKQIHLLMSQNLLITVLCLVETHQQMVPLCHVEVLRAPLLPLEAFLPKRLSLSDSTTLSKLQQPSDVLLIW